MQSTFITHLDLKNGKSVEIHGIDKEFVIIKNEKEVEKCKRDENGFAYKEEKYKVSDLYKNMIDFDTIYNYALYKLQDTEWNSLDVLDKIEDLEEFFKDVEIDNEYNAVNVKIGRASCRERVYVLV